MALCVGAQGISYLECGQWEVSLSYRYLHSDLIFVGSQAHPEFGKPSVTDSHSFDLATTYAFTPRFSVSLTLPFFFGEHTSAFEHDGIDRHSMSADGLGDIRLLGNVWVFDPATHAEGNISLGAGVKAPTGDSNAKDISYQATGPVRRPVSITIQPGDGGWGIVLETQGYQKVLTNTYAYLAGQYLINPRGTNGTEAPTAASDALGRITINSVPDQFLGRVGLFYNVWPEQGFSLSLGGRIEGIPVHDLIGSSDGFRIPGYSISIEPGAYYSRGQNRFSLTTPVPLYRNRTQSVLEKQESAIAGRTIHGGGGFYDVLFIATYSRRF